MTTPFDTVRELLQDMPPTHLKDKALTALTQIEADHFSAADMASAAAQGFRDGVASVQQQEPFGYFRPEPFGWTDCAETDEGAIALYVAPVAQQPQANSPGFEGIKTDQQQQAGAALDFDAQLREIAKRAIPQQAEAVPPKRATGWVAPKDRYTPPVLFNPYTGAPRDVRDVQSDPQGILIAPPGALISAAQGAKI